MESCLENYILGRANSADLRTNGSALQVALTKGRSDQLWRDSRPPLGGGSLDGWIDEQCPLGIFRPVRDSADWSTR